METNGHTETEIINQSPESKLKLPDWINADYFKDVLVSDGKSKWKYISHEARMANEQGENYASVLYRVKVVAENEGEYELHFIYAKKSYENLHVKELFDQCYQYLSPIRYR